MEICLAIGTEAEMCGASYALLSCRKAFHSKQKIPGQKSLITLQHMICHHKARPIDLLEHVRKNSYDFGQAANFVKGIFEKHIFAIYLSQLADAASLDRLKKSYQSLQAFFMVPRPVTL